MTNMWRKIVVVIISTCLLSGAYSNKAFATGEGGVRDYENVVKEINEEFGINMQFLDREQLAEIGVDEEEILSKMEVLFQTPLDE